MNVFFYLGLRLVHIFKILQQIYMHVFIWETAKDVQLYSQIMHFYIAVFFNCYVYPCVSIYSWSNPLNILVIKLLYNLCV